MISINPEYFISKLLEENDCVSIPNLKEIRDLIDNSLKSKEYVFIDISRNGLSHASHYSNGQLVFKEINESLAGFVAPFFTKPYDSSWLFDYSPVHGEEERLVNLVKNMNFSSIKCPKLDFNQLKEVKNNYDFGKRKISEIPHDELVTIRANLDNLPREFIVSKSKVDLNEYLACINFYLIGHLSKH